MVIKNIEINNIKGISKLIHKYDIYPNKVNIFVAPNGFGKSSLGIAFKYLDNTKIELKDKHFHNGDSSNLPIIKLEIEELAGNKIIEADISKNEIRDTFDIFVINSQVKASGTVQRYGPRTIAKHSLDIEKTVLYSKIPSNTTFPYRITKMKGIFGRNSLVLSNIMTQIHDYQLLKKILLKINLNELKLVRTKRPLEKFIDSINSIKTNKNSIIQYIEENLEGFLVNNLEFKKLYEIVKNSTIGQNKSASSCFLETWQILITLNDTNKTFIDKVINYHEYKDFTNFVTNIIDDFNTTRFTVKPKIEKGQLVINWPKADEISNGQRDILNFIALLLKARLNFKKQHQILIIDEIFDYLDDANLISFQYFISNMVEKAKSNEVNFFPILLTHLDPNYFNHFCFSSSKLKIFYLKEYNVDQSINLHKIIYNREHPTIKDKLDEYFFHFNPNQINISSQFENLGLVKEWGDSKKFLRKIYKEVTNYLEDRKYEPLAICFALRKLIEMKAYNLLNNDEDKLAFLNVHGTKNKLMYAQSLGVNIPEKFFLLGIIYNTSLHLYNGQNISNTLAFKFENLTIKKLIKDICK